MAREILSAVPLCNREMRMHERCIRNKHRHAVSRVERLTLFLKDKIQTPGFRAPLKASRTATAGTALVVHCACPTFVSQSQCCSLRVRI